MSNNKQSSVEWLYNKMYEHRGNITIEEFEQAKAMHKEEIMEAHYAPQYGCFSKDYYNKTFGGKDEQQ